MTIKASHLTEEAQEDNLTMNNGGILKNLINKEQNAQLT